MHPGDPSPTEPHPSDPHPSGLPGAPWRGDPVGIVLQAEGRIRMVVSRRAGEDAALVARVAAATGILPDLVACCGRMLAAHAAWLETRAGTRDEARILDQWDAVAAHELTTVAALFAGAGLPVPDPDDANPAPLTPEDEAAFRPGCTA